MKQIKKIFFLLLLNSIFLFKTTCTEKKILLTGAAGFIGSNFLEYMFNKYENYDFFVLDALTYAGDIDNIATFIQNSQRFHFFQGSITDEKLVDSLMSKVDFVVHFAAETHVSRSILNDTIFFETDVMGTRVMMSSLVKYAQQIERYVHISTSEVYGTAEYEPMDEEHPLNPRSPYAAAKAGADRLVYAYCQTYDLPAVILRPFNVYGPRQHTEKVIPRFITSLLNNEPIVIHGDGQQTRDWTFVKDICRAIDSVLHVPHFNLVKNEVINIGSGRPITINKIAKQIVKFFHMRNETANVKHSKDRPGQVKMHITSTKKAKRLLGWEPRIPLSEGLQKTINWYSENKNIWQKKENMKLVPLIIDNTIELQ